jgi:hypothetical protein
MFKLNVPARVRTARLNECGKCKFYNAEHETCGKPMSLKGLVDGTHGGLVDPEEVDVDTETQEFNLVKYYKKKVRLCGCYVKEKTKFSFESCPIGRWGKYRLTDTETNMLEEFIKTLPTKGQLTGDQVNQVLKWFERVSGRPMRRCDECVRAVVKELQLQIGNKQDVQI